MTSNYDFSPEEELYHWKYIKREKVNGKWRYTYKDTRVDRARDNWKTMQRKSYLNRQTADSIRQIANDKRLKKQARYAELGFEWVDHVSGWDRLANITDTLASRDEKIASKAKGRYDKAKTKYKNSFGHTVADILNKTSEIDKGKGFVDRLFFKKKKK